MKMAEKLVIGYAAVGLVVAVVINFSEVALVVR